jgi:hypothetical protein
MGQGLLGRLYRGQAVRSWVDGTAGRLWMVGWGEEEVIWRYAVCQLCLGLRGIELTSLANPGPTEVIYQSAGILTS